MTRDFDRDLLYVLVDGDGTAVAVCEVREDQVRSYASAAPPRDRHRTHSDTVATQKIPDFALSHAVMAVTAAHWYQHLVMTFARVMHEQTLRHPSVAVVAVS